ncbi:Regulatory protein BlaR1 [Stieleria neptunia]|uniref:Regulatory protein BlaR1 n=1 Tax=Stieleria neptunia TaxID=2527979 RepID=A0A518HLS9_9BACT|nr:M56 family metallopeptidase [Stieleria neptunia]QDV41768.1 Regulatory protein BlaR1 [Stieleria neptunia]
MNKVHSQWIDFIVHLATGSTIVLAFGLLAILALRRQSSATKHLVGSLACVTLLLLPFCVAVLPSWRLGIVKGVSVQASQTQTPAANASTSSSKTRSSQTIHGVHSELNSNDVAAVVPGLEAESSSIKDPPPFSFYVLGLYVLGVAYGFQRLLTGHLLARRLTWKSRAVEDAWMMAVGINDLGWMDLNRVRVRISQDISVPMVTGIVRPTILLPESVTSWSDEQLHSAMAHEMAHVERHDLAMQLLASVAAILYWPQPLMRLLQWCMRIDREIACDDKALRGCPKRTDYARHLLDFARQLRERNRDLAGALAMARESNVERRIIAVLSGTRRRSPPASRSVAFMLMASLFCLLGSALVSPFSDGGISNAAAQESQSEDWADESVASGDHKSDSHDNIHVLYGRVLTPDGQPAAGAVVTYPPRAFQSVAIETVADAEGKFALSVPKRSYHSPIVAKFQSERLLGCSEAFTIDEPDAPNVRRNMGDLLLKPAKRIRVQIFDSNRSPVEKAAIFIQGHDCTVDQTVSDEHGQAELLYPDGFPLQAIGALKAQLGCDYLNFEVPGKAHHRDLQQGYEGDIEMHFNGIRMATVKVIDSNDHPVEGIRLDPWYIQKPDRSGTWNHPMLDAFSRTTDKEGVAVFDMFPSDQLKGMQIWPRLTRPDWFVIGTQFHGMSNGSAYVEWERGDSATVRIAPKVRVRGRVILPNGKPAANVHVVASGGISYGLLFNETALSDEKGKWEMLVKPSAYYLFVVQDEHYSAAAHEGVFVPSEGKAEELRFELEPARRVFGKIAGPINESTRVMLQQRSTRFDKRVSHPIQPSEVNQFYHRPPAAIRQFSKRVNADGTYEFKVGPGDYSIWGPGQNVKSFRIADELEKEFNFEL